MSKVMLSDTAEKYLSNLADNIVAGQVELWQLPPSLATLWGYAFHEGRQSLAGTLAQTEADRDTYYERWINPGAQLTEVRQRRIAQAADDYWTSFVLEHEIEAA